MNQNQQKDSKMMNFSFRIRSLEIKVVGFYAILVVVVAMTLITLAYFYLRKGELLPVGEISQIAKKVDDLAK